MLYNMPTKDISEKLEKKNSANMRINKKKTATLNYCEVNLHGDTSGWSTELQVLIYW